MDRFEIYEFDYEDIRQYNQDYGYGAFSESKDMGDTTILMYGSQVGGESTLKAAKNFVYNYYGGWPHDVKIVIYDTVQDDFV